MYKYIVIWVLSTTITTNCPDRPEYNEFGIEQEHTTCSVLHTETITEEKSKYFNNRDSAFAFYNRGLDKLDDIDFSFLRTSISEIKIDSVIIISNE